MEDHVRPAEAAPVARSARRRVTAARRRGLTRLLAVLGLLALLLAPLTVAAQDDGSDQTIVPSGSSDNAGAPATSAANWSAPRTVFIPDTGHSIDGVFLDQWRNGGGVNAYGNPITAEVQEKGHTVQYYQYARFEYWPEDPNGVVVHLGNLGEGLRPLVVRRSLPPAIGGIGGSGHKGAGGADEAARQMRAWLPIDPSKFGPDTDSWRYVPETRHSVSFGFKALWEQTGGASYLGNPLTEEFTLANTTYQIFERGELAWQQGKDPWMVPVGEILAKRYGISTAPQDQGDIPTYSEDLFVPPPPPSPVVGGQPDPNGEKWIEVSLGEQFLTAWQGNTIVLQTYVSTGREGFETPTGTFHILTKLESQTMSGVIGGEYYNVPDVPWVMYFTDYGHALHGTYWHNNFGTPMSHGCVNLPMDVAEWMYGWAPIGTRVEIHD